MKRFTAYRPFAPDTHTELQKNAPDQPQYEGVVWTDGTCTLRWLTACGSTSVWNCLQDMLNIHGHPEYGTYFIWHDGEPKDLPQKYKVNGLINLDLPVKLNPETGKLEAKEA